MRPVSRWVPVLAATAVATLAGGGAWTWGGSLARAGWDAITNPSQGSRDPADAPARARLFLRHVQLLLEPSPSANPAAPGTPTSAADGAWATVGYAPAASLRLPATYALDEGKRGLDVLRLAATGPQGLSVTSIVDPAQTDTRVVLVARPRERATELPTSQALARGATGLLRERGCTRATAAPPPAVLAVPGVLYALLCQGTTPVAALAFERDLLTPGAGRVAVRVTPLVWRSAGFRTHHIPLVSGALLQLGAAADATPGVTLWEVPAPSGGAELFYPPERLEAPCDEWLDERKRGAGVFTRTVLPPRAGTAKPGGSVPSPEGIRMTLANGPVCVLPFTPPFGLEVRRLLPDVNGVALRAGWATTVLVAPAVLLLALLAARARSELTQRALARALSLAWGSVLLAWFAVWRLTWSHRIDMLREFETVGPRVLQNQLLVALAASALAAAAAAQLTAERVTKTRWASALAAWLTWVVVSAIALAGESGMLSPSVRLLVEAGLSLVVGTSALWSGPVTAALTGALSTYGRRLPPAGWLVADPALAGALAALAAIALTALITRAVAPLAVALKLGLAWSLVIAFSAALRGGVRASSTSSHPLGAALLAGALATLALVRLDTGVTTAVVAPGVVLALLVASHELHFDAAQIRRVGGFERHHAPLLTIHVAVLAATGLGIAAWALIGLGEAVDDGMLSVVVTRRALHLLLLFASLLAAAAVLAWRRGRLRASAPWALMAAMLLTAWLARDHAVAAVLDSRSHAASRFAIIVDPGFALLRDETQFLSGVTAWRETTPPTRAPQIAADTAAAEPAPAAGRDGQGYFGAQVVDPGVLLSIDNDYFPVLLLRECGLTGLVIVGLVLMVFTLGLWLLASERFPHGSGAHRGRALVCAVLGAVYVYQPLASLGILPLTGIAWPGLGVDSPSDLWLLLVLTLWLLGPTEPSNISEIDARQDAELRDGRVFQRLRRATIAAAVLLAGSGLALLARGADFAVRRPAPVDDTGRVTPPFEGLARALDYIGQLQCATASAAGPAAEALVPMELLAEPPDRGTRRFHAELAVRWQAQRPVAVALLQRFLDDDTAACSGRQGAWSFVRRRDGDGDQCRATFDYGWPSVVLDVTRGSEVAPWSRCTIEVRTESLSQLRLPARRPYESERFRLVAVPQGAAALDRGELASGRTTVRLRPGAPALDLSRASGGHFLASTVALSDTLSIELTTDGAVLTRSGQPRRDVWLFVHAPWMVTASGEPADDGRWELVPMDATSLRLDRLTLIVVGQADSRSLWRFRPPTDDGTGRLTVPTLLADDVSSIRGGRRRHYVYGGLLPELGWINPYAGRMSVGLDGWIRAALTEYERPGTLQADDPAAAGIGWLDGSVRTPYCGTLAAPVALGPPVAEPGHAAPYSVCARSPLDGVIECRVSVQPELSVQLRHLLELVALDAARFGRFLPPTRAAFALLRGDTGEVLAQGDFVPGRASSAYAPTTPALEQHLVRLREDRDPGTGAKLPRDQWGEASAEKAEWAKPIAIGSTLKPLLARAFELADPATSRALRLSYTPTHGCPGTGTALLGHCPPTSLGSGVGGKISVSEFLARSLNWYQAALGLLGTALPDGALSLARQPVPFTGVASRDLGQPARTQALATKHGGATVLDDDGRLTQSALRATPMWQRFEQLVGRPLCTGPSKLSCVRAGEREDLCGARALPLAAPGADLRHLVALGPANFDLLPVLDPPDKPVSDDVPVREYFQFLRGSGLHPVGSLLQTTDAFNRVVFEADREPAEDGGYRLAASWFPVAAEGRTPERSCEERPWTAEEGTVRGGLCGSLSPVQRIGTAHDALKRAWGDADVLLYGSKTGTIDSLQDLAESRRACTAWNTSHTVPGQPTSARDYWLCDGGRAEDDSLFVLSFGLRTANGIVPLTLGLHFQRVGAGFAKSVAASFVDVVKAYFAPGAATAVPASLPAARGTTTPQSASATPRETP
jgi:hypothetical protein